jgi:hypothetical protein
MFQRNLQPLSSGQKYLLYRNGSVGGPMGKGGAWKGGVKHLRAKDGDKKCFQEDSQFLFLASFLLKCLTLTF